MAVFIIGRGVSDLTTPLTGIATADVVNFVEGSLAITGGLTAASGVGQLGSVNITPDSMRNIGGGTAGALQLGVSGTLEFRASAGSLTIRPECTNAGATTADTIATLLVAGSAQSSVNVVDGGTVTNLRQTSGSVTVADAVTLTNASYTSGTNYIGYNATGLSDLIMFGGALTLRRGIANAGVVRVMGGKLTWARLDSAVATGLAIGTTVRIDIAGPGEIVWMGGDNSSATVIPEVNLLHPKARFIWTGMPADTTITTLRGHPEALAASGLTNPASSATYTSGTSRTLTITNAATIYGESIAKFIAASEVGL